jgi:hypothetical protein
MMSFTTTGLFWKRARREANPSISLEAWSLLAPR